MKKLIRSGLLGIIVITTCVAGGKSTEKHLKKYLRTIFAKPTQESYKAICDARGDYGIPAKLPEDPKLLEFLAYSGDHYRTSYLMLGEKPDRYNIAFEWQVGALIQLWRYYGNENARERAAVILKYALRNIEKMSDREIRSKIDETGLKNFWHPLMKNAVWYYAQLYELTGNEHYAQRTCLILERFGEVFKKWPVYFARTVRGHKQAGKVLVDKQNLPSIRLGYGFWGWWGDSLDLKHALPLVKSWELVKNSKTYKGLSPENKKIIRHDLLELMVEKHLLFKFKVLHNQNHHRIMGVISFGIKLNKPEYVHQGVRWLKEMLHIGYRRDGGWSEGTISYSYDVTNGLLKAAGLLQNWSDPAGYTDPVDGTNFTSFNIEKECGNDFRRIKRVFALLTLPNNKPVAFEDTIWNSKGRYFSKPLINKSIPFLLGASGIGMLGFGEKADQNRLYAHWEGTNNHDHYDQLGITLWSCGEEISSETGYRGLNAWNKSTAAHNTVVIDEKNQASRRRTAKKTNDTLKLYPQYKFGELWGAQSRFDDAGELNLWNVSEKDIQIIQISGLKAYRNLKKYQRSLCMVKVDGNHFYILDVFEVDGGENHDWMLHGNLARRYKINILGANKKTCSPERKIGQYLKNIRSAETNVNITADFTYEKDPVLRTIIAGAPDTEVIVADGPVIRLHEEPSAWGKPGEPRPGETKRKGVSEFLCIRRKGPSNIFVAVHEAFRKNPCVKNVEVSGKVIKVKVNGREDCFEVSDGRIKYSGNGRTVIFGAQNLAGRVFAVTSVNGGDKDNSFIVSGDLNGEIKSGEMIIIVDGDARQHPYIIKELISMPGNKTKVVTKDETGMLLKEDLMIMTYYPSWDIAGALTYRIPGKQIVK